MVTLFSIAYNEEPMIQFMIDHYRHRFPKCRIIIYDNMSTDNTVKIALANRCEVISFDTGDKLLESRFTEIRNNCWKNVTTEWVLVCDMDELLDINERRLKNEEKVGTTIVRSEGYDMVDMENTMNLGTMKYGVRDVGHDKAYLFNKKFVSEINYSLGAHSCNPEGSVVYSKKAYKLFHYCYPNYDVTVRRYKTYRSRVPSGNSSYCESISEIADLYRSARRNAIKVR